MPTKPKSKKNKATAKSFKRVIDINTLDIPHTMSNEEANKAIDVWLERIGRD